jgi:hypothetical protein
MAAILSASRASAAKRSKGSAFVPRLSDYAWPWLPRLPGTAQTGDVADGRSAPHQEVSGTNFIRHDSRLRFAPVHRYARLMIINKSRV